MGQLAQFKLLLWKNYLLQRRKVLVTCLEIGIPTLFALILIFVRQRVVCDRVTNATSWVDFSVDEDLGKQYKWTEHGPWQAYFTPNSASAKHIMQSAVKHVARSCHHCISG